MARNAATELSRTPHEKEKLMSSPSVASPAFDAIETAEREGSVLAAPFGKPAPRVAGRHGKRTEDTGVGCRANAAADLARAGAPGGDYMRLRLEHSAAIWTERAILLERLETKFQRRMRAA